MRFAWFTPGRLFTAVSLVLIPALGAAQTDVEIDAAIQFDFLAPGARSLAMGGAFVAHADDATAAYSNPAGLTSLTRPEASVEYRHQAFTHQYTDRGHGFGPATGIGLDTIDGIVTGESSASTDSLSYLSGVYPGKGWSVGVYRHQLANLEASIQTQGAYFDREPGALYRLFPVDATLDLDIANWGASFAYDLGQGVSVGAGLSFYDFSILSRTERHNLSDIFEPALESIANYQTFSGDDDALSFNAGILWRATPRVNVAAVYRRGPELNFDVTNLSGDGSTVFDTARATFDIPDVFAVGIAVKPTDQLSLSFDYNRVTYSDLTDDTVGVLQNPPSVLAKLRADDADEFHFGGEYVISSLRYPLALRAGVWRDPDHRIVQILGDLEDDPEGREEAMLFRKGDDVWHIAFGGGIVIAERFQIDAAMDLSKRIDIFSLSGVYRF